MYTYTYAKAVDYLAKGRKKTSRPLYHSGLHMYKMPNSTDIGIGWTYYHAGQSHPVVVLHEDDTLTIRGYIWGEEEGKYQPTIHQSIRRVIKQYSGVKDIYRKNFKVYLVTQDAQPTQTKLMGCRVCGQPGKINGMCYGDICTKSTSIDKNKTFQCVEHNYTGVIMRHPEPSCRHGKTSPHKTYNSDVCYSCNGTRKKLYGGKYAGIEWKGEPIRIKDGNLYVPSNEQIKI